MSATSSLQPGVVITLDVEKPVAGGRMLARHHGQVVLVLGAIPGERVTARVERVGKGVVYAHTADVVTPSPDRRPTGSDWRCGGNVLAFIDYPRQLQLKGEIIRDAFARIGRVPLASVPAVVGSPESGYRLRARLHVNEGRIGFYREGSHVLCGAAQTRQLAETTTAWIGKAEQVLQRERLQGLAAIELSESVSGDLRACHLELHRDIEAAPFACLADGLVGLSAARADRPGADVLAGNPVITDTVRVPGAAGELSLSLRRDVRAFFQGNRFLIEPLVAHVMSLVAAGPVVDLYAGVGLFGLSRAAAGAAGIVVVEGDGVSGADLAANAEIFGERVRVERRSVEQFVALLRDRAVGIADATVIVDPPRTGMTRDALTGIIGERPGRVVYVSCDVATFARDTRTLLDSGYELQQLTGFDMFPNTAHVEGVALFTR